MKDLLRLTAAVALVTFAVAPALADYTIPVSTTSQAGGSGSNETHNLAFVVGQPTTPVTASNTTHTLTSGLVSLLLDMSPPTILHSPPVTAVPHLTALEVTALIGDERSGVDTAAVLYREGGSSIFRERGMTRDGNSFSASIPPSAVTESGLLYYVTATDSAGNLSRYPVGAPDTLINVRVWFENLESAFEMPAGQYRMISLPGSADADPDVILVDDLGEYDKKAWRLGRWNAAAGCSTGCFDEYPEVVDMDRGKAFWLITKNAARFDFSGLSTLPEAPFKIHLERGWNQIGTPFAFATDWLSTEILFGGATYALDIEHVVGADTIYVPDNLVSYDGAYHGHEAAMEPWRGYWIHNGSTDEVDLLIGPDGSPAPVLASSAPRGEFDVKMDILVSSPDSPGRTATVGLSPQARDGWDPLDHREPPPFGDYLRVVFERPEWGKHRGTYMTDVRHSSEDGAHWGFRVEASKAGPADVSILPDDGLPQAWSVFLYDRDRGLRVELEELPYAFQMDPAGRFSLIAGTEEFIRLQEDEGGIRLRSQIVGVAPNPFRQAVDIAYYTPGTSRVKMEVFSVDGRLIKTVELPAGKAGMGSVTWHGDSDRQGDVAQGLYFIRLNTGRETHTTKIIKIH